MIFASIREASQKTFEYSGRSERLEHWSFLLLTALCVAVFQALSRAGWAVVFPINWMFVLLFLWLLVANVALMVRRLHDHNVSGFWLFVCTIPLMLMIIAARSMGGGAADLFTAEQAGLLFKLAQAMMVFTLIVFGTLFAQPGDKKPNAYGPPV